MTKLYAHKRRRHRIVNISSPKYFELKTIGVAGWQVEGQQDVEQQGEEQ